ncbi:MAG TPA: glutamine-hydrolyzing carbamoyl-phosphate synthase small subunit [Ktedonobacterales bacterium]|nr:glutamine-hydrolyzing carbamoyl-phosphate synthase small subunit [Ktedonobacterales bacterium]
MDTEETAVLALEDGTIFTGRPFGAVEALHGHASRRGEVVFNTAMTGYQEICTDPSYRGQMVCLTYPLVGNYGVIPGDGESWRPWLSALLVRECCEEYNNWRAAESLDRYLARTGIPGLCDFDTRALTRLLRAKGTLRGVLRSFAPGENYDEAGLIAEARGVATVSALDVVGDVSFRGPRLWDIAAPDLAGSRHAARRGVADSAAHRPRVLLVDTGYKHGIARRLASQGLDVVVVPHGAGPRVLDTMRPAGVLLANGPGDPESVAHLVALTREVLRRRLPLMGVCLGHQILALAVGARTSRLAFGHHGANHPVREVRTGCVTVTSQNHTFQVDADSIPSGSGFYVSHVNLSDGSVEGLAHEDLPAFSVQFHPEAAPGPEDNLALFDRFAAMIARGGERLATAG